MVVCQDHIDLYHTESRIQWHQMKPTEMLKSLLFAAAASEH